MLQILLSDGPPPDMADGDKWPSTAFVLRLARNCLVLYICHQQALTDTLAAERLREETPPATFWVLQKQLLHQGTGIYFKSQNQRIVLSYKEFLKVS